MDIEPVGILDLKQKNFSKRFTVYSNLMALDSRECMMKDVNVAQEEDSTLDWHPPNNSLNHGTAIIDLGEDNCSWLILILILVFHLQTLVWFLSVSYRHFMNTFNSLIHF